MRPLQCFLAVVACGMLASGCARMPHKADVEAMWRLELERATQLAAAEPRGNATQQQRSDRPESGSSWLALAEQLQSTQGPRDRLRTKAAGAAQERRYTHRLGRRGPAYPGEFWHSFGRDAKELAPMIWDDTLATGRNPLSLTMLAAAGITGIVLSGNRGNDQVADHFTRNGSQLNTFWDTVGDVGGNPGLHFGIAGAMYLTSLAREDTKTYEVSKTLLSALAINGLATMGLKVAARTESPNGDEFGWPSGHTSSTFCLATVMYEAYGPWVGVPLMAFAGYVGYERIDARNHDFSDVISGALIGMAIGHAVWQNHETKIFGMDVLPYTDPQRQAIGLALTKQW